MVRDLGTLVIGQFSWRFAALPFVCQLDPTRPPLLHDWQDSLVQRQDNGGAFLNGRLVRPRPRESLKGVYTKGRVQYLSYTDESIGLMC